jgi:PPOX class probable F420-dependent enzyme
MTLPESTYRLFEGDRHATVVTINPDGSPQASLIWIARDGDELVFGVENRRLKTRNLRRDPRITLLIEDDRDSEIGLRQYLVVRGTVTFEGPDIPEKWNELMDAQAQRYFGTPFLLENRGSRTAVIGRIKPERVSGIGPWAA